jgi:triacylglycerol lipase
VLGADFDIEPIDIPGVGVVHRGFWNAWLAIGADVVAAIGNRPVIFVGHSLGAAIAICGAVALKLAGAPPVHVWAFEPPRVSPQIDIAGFLVDVPMTLYKNGNDIVPDLPPDWEHAGLLTLIGKAELPFPNVADHMIARVIAALSP